MTSACETPVHRGVAEAINGDTLRFTRDNGLVDIIRLVSVDAPELYQVCRIDGTEWDCGLEARSTLAALVDERELACMYCNDEPDNPTVRARRCAATTTPISARRCCAPAWRPPMPISPAIFNLPNPGRRMPVAACGAATGCTPVPGTTESGWVRGLPVLLSAGVG